MGHDVRRRVRRRVALIAGTGTLATALAAGTAGLAVAQPGGDAALSAGYEGGRRGQGGDFRAHVFGIYRQALEIQQLHQPGTDRSADLREFRGLLDASSADELDTVHRGDPQLWVRVPEVLAAARQVPLAAQLPRASARPPSAQEEGPRAQELEPPIEPPSIPDVQDEIAGTVAEELARFKSGRLRCPPAPVVDGIYAVVFGLKTAALLYDSLSNLLPIVDFTPPGSTRSLKDNPGQSWIGKLVKVLEVAALVIEKGVIGGIEACRKENTIRFHARARAGIGVLRDLGSVLYAGQQTIAMTQEELTKQLAAGYADAATSLSTLRTSAGTAQDSLDLQLKLRVEAALVAERPAVSFQLPGSAGGHLDTPGGVAQVVATALNRLRATGQPVSSAASRDLALADAALKARHYKKAFHHYRLAYRAVVG